MQVLAGVAPAPEIVIAVPAILLTLTRAMEFAFWPVQRTA